MSLGPPLHVATFHSWTVVSMFGRLCHLFVHGLSSLQVANAQCMTTFSSSLSSRSARKTQVRSRKKTSEWKKTRLAAGKKALQREKAVSAAGKNASKKCCFAVGKIQSSRKNTLQQHKKAPLQQKKCILEAAGKNPSEARESFATQKVAATEKIHFRNGKKQQPLASEGSCKHRKTR